MRKKELWRITDVGETVEDVGGRGLADEKGKWLFTITVMRLRHSMNPKFVSYCGVKRHLSLPRKQARGQNQGQYIIASPVWPNHFLFRIQ